MAISGRYAWILRGNILFLLLFFVSSQGLEEGDPCYIGTHKGKCTFATQCDSLSEAIGRNIVSESNIPKCGLGVFGEIICCPILDLPISTTTVSPVLHSTNSHHPDDPEKTLKLSIAAIFGTGPSTTSSNEIESVRPNTISHPFLEPTSDLSPSTIYPPNIKNLLDIIFNCSNESHSETPKASDTIRNENLDIIFGTTFIIADPNNAQIETNGINQSRETETGGYNPVEVAPPGQFDGENSGRNFGRNIEFGTENGLGKNEFGGTNQGPNVLHGHPESGKEEVWDKLNEFEAEVFPTAQNQLFSDRSQKLTLLPDGNDVVWNRSGEDNSVGTIDNPETNPSTGRLAALACEYFKHIFPKPLTPHIIGGIPAMEGEFPYMAAIGFTDIGNSNTDWRCGGSLIDLRFVLTAAHCVNDPNSQPTVVRLGAINLKTPVNHQDIEINKVYIHDNYTSASKYHDIAILELKTPVHRNSISVRPGCLVTDYSELPASYKYMVTGWGVTEKQRRSDYLLKTELQIVDNANCNEKYTEAQFVGRRGLKSGIVNEQICANTPDFRKDACKGDSGGPLSLTIGDSDNRIVGIVSTGTSCGTSIPGIYINVTSYLDYIESICWKDADFN